ncbi:MFS general substrate transporter [Mycena sanguinolenta]|uniref:MFS general substrate transporter n=1 Tax=Mycena sanguinolenta TaxID=230812 RepID=A0A8H6YEC2_9AGAR|nr:MFS general substrate transporter [Mycena sanguinolenta]
MVFFCFKEVRAYLVVFNGSLISEQTAPNKKAFTDEQEGDRPAASPVPLRKLLTFPVVISVSNYVAVAFLDLSLRSLVPLFMAMPIGIGGLGLPPNKIGSILAIQSIATVLFQLLFFAIFIRRFGERRVLTGAMSMFLLIFTLLPFISTMAAKSGLSATVWALVACLVSLSVVADMCFGTVFMFLLASAPKTSRGAVNGLGQTSVSVARSIGPALATSLFSFSVHYNLLGGHAVYVVFSAISLGAVTLTTRLPVTVWEEEEEG